MSKRSNPNRARLQAIGKMVRNEQPVPLGTVLGNGRERMVVTGHGYYDMDLNRSDAPKPGYQLMYEGDLVVHTGGRVRRSRNTKGASMQLRMLAQNVRAVVIPTEDVL